MVTTSLLACKKMGKPKPLQGLIMLVVSQVLCISLLAIAFSEFPGLCGPHGEPAALPTASCRPCAHSRACCHSTHSDETLGSPHMKPGRRLSLAPLTGTFASMMPPAHVRWSILSGPSSQPCPLDDLCHTSFLCLWNTFSIPRVYQPLPAGSQSPRKLSGSCLHASSGDVCARSLQQTDCAR